MNISPDRQVKFDFGWMMLEFLYECEPPTWQGNTDDSIPATLKFVVFALTVQPELCQSLGE